MNAGDQKIMKKGGKKFKFFCHGKSFHNEIRLSRTKKSKKGNDITAHFNAF